MTFHFVNFSSLLLLVFSHSTAPTCFGWMLVSPQNHRRRKVVGALFFRGGGPRGLACSSHRSRKGSSILSLGSGRGLYRPMAESAWERLQSRFPCLQPVPLAQHLTQNTTPAAGSGAAGGVVQMTVLALEASKETPSPIRYARLALIETLLPSELDDDGTSKNAAASSDHSSATISSTGIQVMNMIVFPDSSSGSLLPVWGADLVSLPGNKHLLLLDSQPMGGPDFYSQQWQDWYQRHDVATQFPWGGDLPEPVQPYVSRHALWSRLSGNAVTNNVENASESMDPVDRIERLLPTALLEHLDLYLDMVLHQSSLNCPDPPAATRTENRLSDYIQYRLENDPARPMLKRLYGEEWTEQVLHKVLFPPLP